jgi:hypothetical protein
MDLFPTIMDLCGKSMPETKPLDGISLAPLLRGTTEDWPDRMLFTFRSWAGNTDNMRGAVRTQRWRAVKDRHGWELYDMLDDPGQEKDLASEHPDVLARLRLAYEDMLRDVTKHGFEPIPTHVGYPDWPLVTLHGHEAFLEPARGEGISYRGASGWANDWITNWTETDAYAWWPLKVVRPGRFEVTLLYVCPKEDVGTKFRVELGGRTVEGTVREAHDPETIHSPDRVARNEVYEKVWAKLLLGTVELTTGGPRLILRALDIPGHQAADIKAVQLRRTD